MHNFFNETRAGVCKEKGKETSENNDKIGLQLNFSETINFIRDRKDIIDVLSSALKSKNNSPASKISEGSLPKIEIPKQPKSKRGSYNKYTKITKKKAIDQVVRIENYKTVSETTGIPIKNLRRWVTSTFLNKNGDFIRNQKVPKAGTYNFTANVVTVTAERSFTIRANRRSMYDVPVPLTVGEWMETSAVPLELKEGRNKLQLTLKAPNKGLTMKSFTLTPVK